MARAKTLARPLCDGCRLPKALIPKGKTGEGLCFTCNRERSATAEEVCVLLVQAWYAVSFRKRSNHKDPVNMVPLRNALLDFLDEFND
jgi:hypothetical protein